MVKLNEDPKCWQGPGGTKPFDSPLSEWKKSKLTKRYIYVLKFLYENKNSEILIFENQKEFNDIICKYLDSFNIDRPKKPTPTHFYTPYQFVDFIGKNNFSSGKKFELFITQSGEKFLKEIERGDYELALNIYLNNLVETKFPNDATAGVDLNLYPVKIMFKILYENGAIPKFMFLTDIQYINDILKLESCLILLDDDKYLLELKKWEALKNKDIVEFNRLNIPIAKEKWTSYVCGGLVSLGVLEKICYRNGYISLSKMGENFVEKSNLPKISYASFFKL